MAIKILKNSDNVSSLENLIKEISKSNLKSLDVKNLVIVKDNFSLTVEKMILQRLSAKGSFSIDVLSFSRMLAKYNNQLVEQKYLTNFGGVMLICKIALENKDKLLCYKNSVGHSGFYKRMYELIMMLKGARISFLDFNAVSLNGFPTYLKNKIHDIKLFYGEYERQIKDRFFDENTKLDILCDVIEKNEVIHNANIFLTNFDSYTQKDYKVLSYLLRHAKNVVFSVVVDETNGLYTNEAYFQIVELLGQMELEYETIDAPRFNNVTAEHIRNNLYSYGNVKCKHTKDIKIYEANDYEDEIERVASLICEKVRSGYRYSDFMIVSQDHDGYRQRLDKVFSICKIPYYLATDMKLIDHPVIRLIKDVFDCSNAAKSCIAVAKNPLSDIDFESAVKYENYLIKYGYRDDLKYEIDDFASVKNTHEKCGNILKSFKKGVFTAKEHCDNMLEFLGKNDMERRLEKLSQEQSQISKEAASFTEQAYENIKQILIQLEFIYNNFFLTDEDFFDMFLSGISAIKVSVIPMSNDCVMAGSINDLKFSKAKGMFIIGSSEGNIPPLKKDLGLLFENDVLALGFAGLQFHNLEYVNRKEALNLVLLMQNFTDFLHVSYSRLSGVGEKTARAGFISDLLDIFDGLYIENAGIAQSKMALEEFWNDAANELCASKKSAYLKLAASRDEYNKKNQSYRKFYSSLFHALKNLGYDCGDFQTDWASGKEALCNSDKLFFSENSVSASALETFFSCPYKNFIQRGLKLFEREQAGLNQMDIGTYLHKIAEQFTNRQEKVNFDYESCKIAVDNIVSGVLQSDAYSYIRDDKAGSIILSRLKEEAYKVCFHILKQFRYGKFKLKGTEIEFFKDGCVLDGDIRLSGKIDRVDEFQNYVRVIDYKTGSVDTSIKSLYLGTKMQLNLYLKQLESKGCTPVAAFYFPVHNEFTTKDELDYRLKGRMILEPEILQITDGNMQGGSEIISAYESNGEYKTRSKDYLLDSSAFSLSVEYSARLAKKGVEYMKQGVIDINPAEDTCKYCNAKNICEYDKLKTKKRELKAMPALCTITEAVKNAMDESARESNQND